MLQQSRLVTMWDTSHCNCLSTATAALGAAGVLGSEQTLKLAL
jgi:hypothetical protein